MLTDMKPRTRRLARWLVKAALLGCVCLVLLEILLRVAGYYYKSRFWEARGRHPAAERATVLALGESTTAGMWLPVEESYPKQLQARLREHYGTPRIRVVIPPHIGQNTSQMLARFPQYLETFEPDVVVIMAGVNNTWSLAESNLGEFMPPGDWRTRLFRWRRWLDDVKVFRLGRLLITGAGETRRSLEDDLAGKPRMATWPPEDDPLVRNIGREPFLRLWRSDVGQMIQQAEASGAAVLLMTYPNYDTPPVSEFVDLAKTHSLLLVENHRPFAEIIDQGRAAEFFFEDLRHPNAKGYAIIADNVFRSLLANELLDEKVRQVRLD